MLLIWEGRGTTVVLISTGAIASAVILAAVLGTGYTGSLLLIGAALLAAGLWIWRLGRKWNSTPGRTLIDPGTGEVVVLRDHHSLFFLPMQWWGRPVAAVGALAAMTAVLQAVGATSSGR